MRTSRGAFEGERTGTPAVAGSAGARSLAHGPDDARSDGDRVVPARRAKPALDPVELRIGHRGVVRGVAREASPGEGGVARAWSIWFAGGRPIEFDSLGRVALVPLHAPDALDEPRCRSVQPRGARTCAFANRLGFDGFGERQDLRPRWKGRRRARERDRAGEVVRLGQRGPAFGQRARAALTAARCSRRQTKNA
jgi:hypothetical protein